VPIFARRYKSLLVQAALPFSARVALAPAQSAFAHLRPASI